MQTEQDRTDAARSHPHRLDSTAAATSC